MSSPMVRRRVADTGEPVGPYSTIAEVGDLIRRQELSPVDIVRQSLKRIEALQPTLNAFITIMADEALMEASTAEAEIKAGRWRGSLHGIPIGIKDMFDTAGTRTTAAFELFQERIP